MEEYTRYQATSYDDLNRQNGVNSAVGGLDQTRPAGWEEAEVQPG